MEEGEATQAGGTACIKSRVRGSLAPSKSYQHFRMEQPEMHLEALAGSYWVGPCDR
jgi:hypothetical protein